MRRIVPDPRQRSFDFPAEGSTPPFDRTERQRLQVSRTIALKTSSEEIRRLIARGAVASGTNVESLSPAARFVRDNRLALKEFVQLLANGGYAPREDLQPQAIALLREFDALSDSDLARKLKELGLCESTRSFGKEIGSYCYLLFGFRKAMGKK